MGQLFLNGSCGGQTCWRLGNNGWRLVVCEWEESCCWIGNVTTSAVSGWSRSVVSVNSHRICTTVGGTLALRPGERSTDKRLHESSWRTSFTVRELGGNSQREEVGYNQGTHNGEIKSYVKTFSGHKRKQPFTVCNYTAQNRSES